MVNYKLEDSILLLSRGSGEKGVDRLRSSMSRPTDPDASLVASPWELLCGGLLSCDRLLDNYITQRRVRWTRRLARLLLRAAYEKHERVAAAEHRLLLAQRAAEVSSLRLQALLAQQQQQQNR